MQLFLLLMISFYILQTRHEVWIKQFSGDPFSATKEGRADDSVAAVYSEPDVLPCVYFEQTLACPLLKNETAYLTKDISQTALLDMVHLLVYRLKLESCLNASATAQALYLQTFGIQKKYLLPYLVLFIVGLVDCIQTWTELEHCT